MDCNSMMEASNSTSVPEQNVTYGLIDFFKSTGSRYQNIDHGPCPDKCEQSQQTKYGTSVDDQRQLAEENEAIGAAVDKLKDAFHDILQLKIRDVTSALSEPSSSTQSSSLSLDHFSMMENNITGNHVLSPKEIHNLRSIAEKMDSKGCLDELVDIYVKDRKSFINVCFQKLWDEKSETNIQRLETQVLEVKIMRWIRATRCSLDDIFAYEKQLSKNVFQGLVNANDETCFVAIVRGPVTQLLDFAEALASCRRSPERIQKFLLLYSNFFGFMPDFNSVFESEESKTIRLRADYLLFRLGDVVRFTLSDFEAAVLGDLDKFPIPNGTIHPLTRYVMGYTISLAENKEILMGLITSKPSTIVGDVQISDFEEEVRELEERNNLAAHLLWIVIILRLNLKHKSKCYQDPLLADLFMMNNVNDILQQIRGSAILSEMIEDNSINKLAENVGESMTNYLTGTWDVLVYCLRHEGLHIKWGFTSKVSNSILKERVNSFNSLFKEIYSTQMMWEVPDRGLRMKLQQSILAKLIPPYANFLGQFKSQIERGKHGERYILYSAKELENKVLRLFSHTKFLDEDQNEQQSYVPNGGDDVKAGLMDDAQSFCGSNSVYKEAGEHRTSVQTVNNGLSSNSSNRLCRNCGKEEATLLILPCRHLCLCPACRHFVDICPICNSCISAVVFVQL